jgi:putative FmdB family regulatory protein
MPIFEYRCLTCGIHFELLVLPAFASAAECPSCQSKNLEKLISLAAISSEHTQKRARREGSERGRKLREDLSNEEHKRILSHEGDHHDH